MASPLFLVTLMMLRVPWRRGRKDNSPLCPKLLQQKQNSLRNLLRWMNPSPQMGPTDGPHVDAAKDRSPVTVSVPAPGGQPGPNYHLHSYNPKVRGHVQRQHLFSVAQV